MSNVKVSRVLAAGVIACALAAGLAGGAGATPRSLPMIGTFDTPTFSGPSCPSPVGLCFAGQFRGTLAGPGDGSVNSLTPTAQAGVLLGDGIAVIHDHRGDVVCGHEQVIVSVSQPGDGEYSFVCEITSGTGRYAGATGYLYGTGHAPPGTGQDSGTYAGKIVLA
jgi:hypothetical protein